VGAATKYFSIWVSKNDARAAIAFHCFDRLRRVRSDSSRISLDSPYDRTIATQQGDSIYMTLGGMWIAGITLGAVSRANR